MEWHGLKVEQGAVFYIKGEGHNGFGYRLAAFESHYNVDFDDIPFYASKVATNLCDSEYVIEVVKSIINIIEETNDKPVLIVIDTLARNFDGDENSAKDMGKFINNIENLIRSKFNCSVLIVHHTGHATPNRARGSSSFKAALEFEFKVEEHGDNGFQFLCTKMKDDIEPEKMSFTMHEIEIYDEEGIPLSSLVISCTDFEIKQKATSGLGKVQHGCIELLKDLQLKQEQILVDSDNDPNSARVLINDWSDAIIEHRIFEEFKRQSLYRVKKSLVKRKLIEVMGNYVKLVM